MEVLMVRRLLLAWGRAWEKYQNYSSPQRAGGLPGLALVVEILDLKGEHAHLRGKYLRSKERAAINQAFLDGENEEWLQRLDTPKEPHEYYSAVDFMAPIFADFWSCFSPDEVAKVLSQYGGTDNLFWRLTYQGKEEAQKLVEELSGPQKGRIGFIKDK